MNNLCGMIDRKVEIATLVSAAFLASGLLKFYVYYKSFNLNILPFVSVEEIMVGCFDSLIYYVCYCGLTVLIIFTYFRNLVSHGDRLEVSTFRLRLGLYLERFWLRVVSFVVLSFLAALYNYQVRPNPDDVEFFYWSGCFLVSFFILPILFFELNRFLRARWESEVIASSILVFSCMLLIVGSILLAMNEAEKVRSRGYYDGGFVVLNKDGSADQEVLESSADYFFIGKTSDYFFFFSRKNSQVDVYPMRRVLKMSVK